MERAQDDPWKGYVDVCVCVYCGKKIHTDRELQQHMSEVHDTEQIRQFRDWMISDVVKIAKLEAELTTLREARAKLEEEIEAPKVNRGDNPTASTD